MRKDDGLQRNAKGLNKKESYTGGKVVSWFFYTMCTFIIIFSYFLGEKSIATFYATNALLWGVMSAEVFAKFKISHKKAELVVTILEAITSVASIVTFIIISLR